MKFNDPFLLNLLLAQQVLHNTDPANQGGGGGGSDPAAAFQRLLDQHKQDALSVASKLFDENFEYRRKNREMKEKLPAEGSVVLTGDDVKAWEVFKGLNMKPDEVKAAIEKVTKLESENRELAAMETLREIADIGLDGSKLKLSVLKDQIGRFPEASITIKEEKTADGKAVRNVYIKSANDAAEVPFADFAKDKLADYLPSLKVSDEAQTQQQNFTGSVKDPNPQGGPASFFDKLRSSLKEEAKTTPQRSVAEAFGRGKAV